MNLEEAKIILDYEIGEDHIVTKLAEETPWMLLKGVPLRGTETPERAMEIVKDFEKPNER